MPQAALIENASTTDAATATIPAISTVRCEIAPETIGLSVRPAIASRAASK